MFRKYITKCYKIMYWLVSNLKIRKIIYHNIKKTLNKLLTITLKITKTKVNTIKGFVIVLLKTFAFILDFKIQKPKNLKWSFKILKIFSQHIRLKHVRYTNRLSSFLCERIDYNQSFDHAKLIQIFSFIDSNSVFFFNVIDIWWEVSTLQEDSWEDIQPVDLRELINLNLKFYQTLKTNRRDRLLKHAIYIDSIQHKLWRSDLYYPEFNETP